MAKNVKVIPLPCTVGSPAKRNNDLYAWLGGAGNSRDIRSITWAKESKQWIIVTMEE
ncbi:MAG: hypothetical protein GY809_22910 [Planctomycetes bacterium]|nr:hypothetical protein [Planctomycetota bacterium]